MAESQNNILPYFIDPARRAILFHHLDIDESWWNRGMSRSEADMQKIESLLREATGLQRIWRRHHIGWHVVEIRLSQKHYKQAAVALRLTYQPDPDWNNFFKRFLRERLAQPDRAG